MKIPISYIVMAQRLYVHIFEWEDDDGIPCDEYRSYAQSKRAYNDYLDKMFLNDKETANLLDQLFNSTVLYCGTYREICDFLRKRGYQVVSLDNATKEEIKQCERDCLEAWKKWKTMTKHN